MLGEAGTCKDDQQQHVKYSELATDRAARHQRDVAQPPGGLGTSQRFVAPPGGIRKPPLLSTWWLKSEQISPPENSKSVVCLTSLLELVFFPKAHWRWDMYLKVANPED